MLIKFFKQDIIFGMYDVQPRLKSRNENYDEQMKRIKELKTKWNDDQTWWLIDWFFLIYNDFVPQFQKNIKFFFYFILFKYYITDYGLRIPKWNELWMQK